jgi:NAD(P)-dependent dehydrogenase (short-subunit alcohol dehydrogenase family)
MGGLRYAKFAGDVAYGVGKAAGDRLINDIAHELKPHNVAAISLWPGAVNTEMTMARVEGGKGFGPNAESPEFAGASIVALYKDPKLMQKTGKVLLTTELATELKFTDIDGRVPSSHPPGLRKAMSREVPLQWKLDAAL